MDEKFNRRFLSFCKSLDALAETRQRDLTDSFVLSGTSAKSEVLKESFRANLISDDQWMEMLKVRNELTHDYDSEIVKEHCNEIGENYIDLSYVFKEQVNGLIQGS